jgi:hypothetical protein
MSRTIDGSILAAIRCRRPQVSAARTLSGKAAALKQKQSISNRTIRTA